MKSIKFLGFTAAGLLAGGLFMSSGQAGVENGFFPHQLIECAQNNGTGGMVIHWNKIVFRLGGRVANAATPPQPAGTELEVVLPGPPVPGLVIDLKGYLLEVLYVDDNPANRNAIRIEDVEYSTMCQEGFFLNGAQ